jgi:hypothetical protein
VKVLVAVVLPAPAVTVTAPAERGGTTNCALNAPRLFVLTAATTVLSKLNCADVRAGKPDPAAETEGPDTPDVGDRVRVAALAAGTAHPPAAIPNTTSPTILALRYIVPPREFASAARIDDGHMDLEG